MSSYYFDPLINRPSPNANPDKPAILRKGNAVETSHYPGWVFIRLIKEKHHATPHTVSDTDPATSD